MVVFNRFELTMLALGSLRDNFAGAIELILVDNDSTDDTRRISEYVLGAKIFRAEQQYRVSARLQSGAGACYRAGFAVFEQ